ncbi:MAG: DUF1573 domain-containing protein [Chitinophagaceae bacterium]
MKRILVAFCALALATSVMAQTKPVAQTAAVQQKKADELVKFTEVKHDFGKIKQSVPVTYDFAFQNVGNQPAVIESATASCGCTTPTWPKTPVAKSKADKISAGFNAASPGIFNKTITVKVAGYDQPLELTITGEVLSAEEYAKYEGNKPKKNG